jgi:two-component system, cell cycle response regulator
MNVLLVEDDVILNDTITHYLKIKGNDVTSLDDGMDAIEVIDNTEFDLYIIDINIPKISGLKIVKYIRKKDLKTPIVMITASIKLKNFKKAYKNGCDDYIKKPFYLDELEIRINKLMEKENLEMLATTDCLTELVNRRHLDDILLREGKISKRYDHQLGVLLMDIDHFKQVNDKFGHEIGDIVLKEVAKILKGSVRDSDIPGRWGGEEFLIICHKTPKNGLCKLAEIIRCKIETHQFPHVENITTSFGAACLRKEEDIRSLLNRADKALYISKNEGRNRWSFAE